MTKTHIYDRNGKAISTIDPMKIGIEDLIEMQNITRGQGTGMTTTDIFTVIIYELARTKQYALKVGEELKKKEEQISELEGKLISSKLCTCPE